MRKTEKNHSIAEKHDIDIDDNTVKKLAEAFAVLEPWIPNIKKLYFSKLQLQDCSSDVVVITRDGTVQ